MKLVNRCTLPIKTISEANSSEHWTKKNKRHQLQKWCIKVAFLGWDFDQSGKYHIKMIRISPRFLDDDNLVSAFKHIRDSIAENLRPGKAAGQADNDKSLSWECSQEKGKPQMVRIEFYEPLFDEQLYENVQK